MDYDFISQEQFQILAEGEFFAETASYNGWWYGSSIYDYASEIGQKAKQEDKDFMTSYIFEEKKTETDKYDSTPKVIILTPKGLRQIKRFNFPMLSFYINIPRRERLIKILERGDDIEEAYRRNLSDVGQFDGIENEVDYVLDNVGYNNSVYKMAAMLYSKYLEYEKEKVNKLRRDIM